MLFAFLAFTIAAPDGPASVQPPTYWEHVAVIIAHKNYQLAETLITHAPIRNDDDKLRQETFLARVYLLQKRYSAAEPILIKLVDKDPPLADRHLFELAQVRLGRGDFSGALQTAEGVDPEGLYSSEAEVVRVNALSGLGRLEEAGTRCRQISAPAKKAEWRLACGRVFLLRKENDEGESMLRAVVRHDLLKPEARIAEQVLITTLPSYKDKLPGDLAFGRGEQLLKRRHLDLAKQAFKTALEKSKDAAGRAESALRLADIDERRQNFEQALATYLRAADLGDKDDVSEQALFAAGTLATRLKNLTLAQSIFQRLLLEHPLSDGRDQALFGLGFTAFLAHDFAGANQFLRTLLTQNDLGRVDKQRARYWFGRSEEALGHPANAQLSYSEIVRDDPAGYYAVRAGEQLQTLGMAVLDLPPDAVPKSEMASNAIKQAVQRVLALARRALRGEAMQFLDRLAHGKIPTQDDAVALHEGFLALGESVKADVVLAAWRYDHLGELTEQQKQETLRLRHPRLFADGVAQAATREGLPPTDVFAIIRQESRFLPRARSPCGARGLMQLMWGTAREVARQVRVAVGEPDTLYRPDVNLRLGAHYLAWLERRYEHKEFAIAAYNAGPGNIDRWQKLFGDLPMDVFCELIPFAETRDYVQRVMGYKRGYDMTGKATAAN